MLVVLAAGVCALALAAAPASASVDSARPYVYISPQFTPKSMTGGFVHITSGDDATQPLDVRRYNHLGQLLSSTTNLTVAPHGRTALSISASGGNQMHVEVWADTPALLTEETYTDIFDVGQRIPAGDWRVVGPTERTVPGAIASLQGSVTGLEPPLLALGPQINAFQSGVTGLIGPVNGSVAELRTQVTRLKTQVSRLRKQMSSLRKLIVKRLPAR